ncbi:MAG: hydroxyphenylacetyl-CoA thioesterase PaaI [Pseudomonadota bacterium]
MTSEERARQAADAMWQGDDASRWFGMELIDVAEGRATLALQVEPHHCNGHGTCHGGVIFALADSAFAFACNSRNQKAVAQHCIISYLEPVHSGARLIADAVEVSYRGRSGLYDIHVSNTDGDLVAEFRGMSRTIPGHHVEDM